MDCGVPFCHTGCPLNNLIPDWNDLVYPRPLARSRAPVARHQQLPGVHRPHLPGALRGVLRAGHQRAGGDHQADREGHRRSRLRGRLHQARAGRRRAPESAWPSSAPGRRAWPPRSNWRAPDTTSRSSRRATASAACCATASRNFKMEKHLIDRRLEQMRAEGVKFQTNAHVGGNVPVEDLRKEFDAILLAGGAEQPRDLKVPGRELQGHPLRHGVPAAAEPALRRRRGSRRRSHPGHRQARGDHRRRRHRRRLPGHQPPAGRALRDPVRIAAQASRRALARDALAALAHAVARRELARRRRRARLERVNRSASAATSTAA